MPLTCTCHDFDMEPGSWFYYHQNDFSVFSETRRKRCCSCNDLIDHGADCIEFPRIRAPYDEIEERINGEEILIASWFMCESCGEIYLNLNDIGYCLNIGEDMRELLKEYHDKAGFNKE